MKKLLSILLITFSLNIFSQSMIDVVHLKNGSIIKGTITEMNPTGNIKIQTSDGSVFVYKTSDVLKMNKEKATNNTSSILKQSNSVISQKSLKDFFSNYLTQKRPALKFIAVSKVNGVQKEVFGQKIYEVEYELLLEPKQDIYINASQFGSAWASKFVDNFAYGSKPSGGYESALAGSKKKISKGQRILATGTLNFENTDNGWRSNSFKNKTYKVVTSNYVSSSMAKEIAIKNEKAKQLKVIERENNKRTELERSAKLRKSLDWQRPDIATVESKTNFYEIHDIPYFGNAGASYSVKKSDYYVGRNDVFATIQKSIFQSIASTARMQNSNEDKYKSSENKATCTFTLEKVDFNFVANGYQCSIDVKANVSGEYQKPKTLKATYTVPFKANNTIFSLNLSKRQAVDNALRSLTKQVQNFIYKYEPIEFKVEKILTSRSGKAEYILFKRTQQLTQKKMKFIILPKSGLEVKGNAFSINSKIGECTYKGDTTADGIKCKISGRKNRKAIEKYLNSTDNLIGISI